MSTPVTVELDYLDSIDECMLDVQNMLTVAIAAVDQITEHIENTSNDKETIALSYGVYTVLRDCCKKLEDGRLRQANQSETE